MGCITSSNNEKNSPPIPKKTPKSEIEEVVTAPSTIDLKHSISHSNPTASTEEDSIHSISLDTHSWKDRRNSQKEKETYYKRKTKEARIELGKRITHRATVNVKCTKCGDIGPESSNQYCGFYLLVNEIDTKTKCRRCNIPFSYRHIGVVKTINEVINEIIQESLQ